MIQTWCHFALHPLHTGQFDKIHITTHCTGQFDPIIVNLTKKYEAQGGPWKGFSCYQIPLINLYGMHLPIFFHAMYLGNLSLNFLIFQINHAWMLRLRMHFWLSCPCPLHSQRYTMVYLPKNKGLEGQVGV